MGVTAFVGGYWWLAKFRPLSSLLIVLNQQLVKSCSMRQNFDGTKMRQNRRKIKPRPLCSEYPYQNKQYYLRYALLILHCY